MPRPKKMPKILTDVYHFVFTNGGQNCKNEILRDKVVYTKPDGTSYFNYKGSARPVQKESDGTWVWKEVYEKEMDEGEVLAAPVSRHSVALEEETDLLRDNAVPGSRE